MHWRDQGLKTWCDTHRLLSEGCDAAGLARTTSLESFEAKRGGATISVQQQHQQQANVDEPADDDDDDEDVLAVPPWWAWLLDYAASFLTTFAAKKEKDKKIRHKT